MMLWKWGTQYVSKSGKLSSGHRTGKGVFIPVPKKGNAKDYSNYNTTAPILHPSKVMLKVLQARLQLYTNQELPDVQAGFNRRTKDKIGNIYWIIEKAREFQKIICFCFIDSAKAFGKSNINQTETKKLILSKRKKIEESKERNQKRERERAIKAINYKWK